MSFRHFCVFLAVVLLSVSSSATLIGRIFRIVAGRTASTVEFPYQAALERGKHSFCGGSVIGDRFVLTAAHCVKSVVHLNPVPEKVMVVRVGHDVSVTDGFVHAIEKVKVHPKYDDKALMDQFDVALVKLRQPFKFGETVKAIDLSEETPKEGELGVVTGYGKQQVQRMANRHLMAVILPIVSLENCRKSLNHVADDMICAGWKKGHGDSCQGDSGGPLAMKGQLVGIVAWGLGCGREGIPGVYTNVALYQKWVKDAMTTI